MLSLDTSNSTNLDLSDMEASVLHCVNPYDVNPINGASGKTSAQDETDSSGRPVKLEMEEFSDLAPFLPEDSRKTNAIDELNTPTFDRKGPFNFMVYENTYIESPSATDPFKFEYDIIRTGNSVLSNKQPNDFSVYSNVNVHATIDSEVVNIVQGSEANLLFTTSESDQGNIYIINGNETPMNVQDQVSASILKVEDANSVLSATENQYSNVSSPCNEYSVNTNQNLGIETPEDTNSSCSSEPSTPRTIPKLKLNLGFNQAMVLNTPDVIDSVVDLETSFNILDYVNEKDVTTVNIEDIPFDDPTTSALLDIPIQPKSRRRSKRYDDDDDEDYVPPSKKLSKREPVVSSDSDSDEELPRGRRGRPQRRTSSISSEHSDANKYRELRDKNNEASRKSRLKRKVKEMTLQKEADELYEKNVKLKAQVEEFERMVNNFRSNLFKIMLKK